MELHVGDSSIWNPQQYVPIYLGEIGKPQTIYWQLGGWCSSSYSSIYMYIHDYRSAEPYTDEQYLRTVAHEMGHVFGIDDGYPDVDDPLFFENLFGVTQRPDAKDIIDDDDVMRYNLDLLNISNVDIGMLICAYLTWKQQAYADYWMHNQSIYIDYINQGGKE